MLLGSWNALLPAAGAAFAASLVEAVEACTIVLAVGSVRGWRPAIAGTLAGLAVLAALVVALGAALQRVPLRSFQLAIGILLLLFGMRWLRKAILRLAGRIRLHDEAAAFAAATVRLGGGPRAGVDWGVDWGALATAFQAVLLEGLEVVFIVIAVGLGRDALWPAGLGAAAACLVVVAAGILLRRPLARVPENTLKFVVGVMLSAFGVFWTGEGLGIDWPGGDLALGGFMAAFLAVALVTAAAARQVAARRYG
jgi:uncharacterized membrane protein